MNPKRFLVFGAHPDDPDVIFGGTAVLLARAGHIVKFVSVTNGEAGHQSMGPAALIARRYAETQASAKAAGLFEYQVLSNRDARLENTLENRELLTTIIREFRPDVVLSHRLCDYHPDHRTTAQLVLDTSFLVRVPHFCPSVPVPEHNPVYAYSFDMFTDPRPVRPDAVVAIDSVLEEKFRLLDCHKSQFYEWLPWVDLDMKHFDASKMTWPERFQFLREHWGGFYRAAAKLGGLPDGSSAEVFELSPYGRRVTTEEFRSLFTDL